LFEPNDAQTRHEVKAACDALLSELVSQRALYDFLVVCDSTNNTPARIDRSELWVDIAIEPVKAVEFIYIPLRIMNTGEIAAMNK
jgi:phage tail sheath protein FI